MRLEKIGTLPSLKCQKADLFASIEFEAKKGTFCTESPALPKWATLELCAKQVSGILASRAYFIACQWLSFCWILSYFRAVYGGKMIQERNHLCVQWRQDCTHYIISKSIYFNYWLLPENLQFIILFLWKNHPVAPRHSAMKVSRNRHCILTAKDLFLVLLITVY